MANVRLLRQSIEDYQKKYNATNKNYKGAYDKYVADFNAVKAETEAYNAAVSAAASGGDQVWLPYKGGYNLFGGIDGTLHPVYTGVDGGMVLNPVSTLPDKNAAGSNTVMVRNGDSIVVYSRLDASQDWHPISAPGSESFKLLSDPPAAPVAPAEPEKIEAPRLTTSNSQELQNPSENQAGLQLQAAKGILGKSNLAGDRPEAMRNSVFADPEDPQGLKDRGVLARVLGGQL